MAGHGRSASATLRDPRMVSGKERHPLCLAGRQFERWTFDDGTWVTAEIRFATAAVSLTAYLAGPIHDR